ncbi:hypothetical protein LXA43DRAFT_1058409 [Ganoderma leucocontextum]|nr:hypothetical protein LXA43DRAFT_1058409 [Ganoderma leucocontextum]
MLPLSLLSACAAVLVIPASAAPLSFESSDHQRPTRFLAPSPKQRLTTDRKPASGDAPDLFLLMPRGAAFREADYAVNAAAEANPAVFAAAAPTRAVLLRRDGSITSSSGSGHKAQMDRPSTDDLAAPVALAAAPSPLGTFHFASALGPGTDPSTSKLSQPASEDRLLKPDGLSGFNKAFAAPLIQPDTPAGAPGPEARPQFRNADRTLSQNQMDSTDATPPNAAALAQVNGPNGQVVEISKDADAPPQVNAMGSKSDPSGPAVSRKIGTVDSQYDHQGPLEPSRHRHLSDSFLYPAPQPADPRAADSLAQEEPAPGAALVKSPVADMDVERRTEPAPSGIRDTTLPSVGDQKRQGAQKFADETERAPGGEGVTGTGAVSRVGGEQRAIPDASQAGPNAHNKGS